MGGGGVSFECAARGGGTLIPGAALIKMEVGAPRRDGAEEILPKDLNKQNSCQGNQPDVEDGKNIIEEIEYVPSLEKMETEFFDKPNETVRSDCGTQAAQQASPSGTSKENCQPSSSPKKPSSQKDSHRTEHASASFNVSFGQLPSPRVARQSWHRSSLKQDGSRRKSLLPLQQDVTDLSNAISLNLPDTDRMVELLLSSFQYSARKLGYSLKQTEGFDPETFEQNVNTLSEELWHCTKRLKLDGTLQKCFEDLKRSSADPALDDSIAALKENIARFSAESQAWDRLLLFYQKNAEELSRQLQEECKLKQGPKEPFSYLGSSQAHVLQAKPDYQKILDSQGEVFDCMELVLDDIHQAVKCCQTYMEGITQYLQKLSVQLVTGISQRLDNSPVRKLLRLPQIKTAASQPSEG